MTSHMRREIAEQPAAVAATLAAVAEPAAALAAAVRERGLDRVVLVARGTSDHVAIYARYLLEARCALSASLAAPSLYTTYRPPVDLSRALVLGVSQSGETPEIAAALQFGQLVLGGDSSDERERIVGVVAGGRTRTVL